ncbi:MAG: hypothetical protein V2A69_11550 [Pseudomonadota bacterium]
MAQNLWGGSPYARYLRSRPACARRAGKRQGEGQGRCREAGGLKEAQSKSAGRRTGTRYEVWYIRDEGSREAPLYPDYLLIGF